jgi:hypothetical protein
MQSTKGERRYRFYSFLTMAIDGVNDQHHDLAAFYLQEWMSGTCWIGGWVCFRAGLDTEARGKILFPYWGSNPGCPVCSQTLCWLSYSGPYTWTLAFLNFKFKCRPNLTEQFKFKTFYESVRLFQLVWMLCLINIILWDMLMLNKIFHEVWHKTRTPTNAYIMFSALGSYIWARKCLIIPCTKMWFHWCS